MVAGGMWHVQKMWQQVQLQLLPLCVAADAAAKQATRKKAQAKCGENFDDDDEREGAGEGEGGDGAGKSDKTGARLLATCNMQPATCNDCLQQLSAC